MGRVAEYGKGHPNFVKYVREIVHHPAYEGMPDVHLEDGGVQWEAPSNRTGGKNQHTHQRRLDWWRRKARSIGIDPDRTSRWISKTAKQVHPTKIKPCKNCGLELAIAYAYPTTVLMKRLQKLPYLQGDSFEVGNLDDIRDIVSRLHARFGARVFESLPALLRSKGVDVPSLPSQLEPWLRWLEERYIPAEPATLGPGVMSNAPDRLDGFHSFNRCCRHKADSGRSKTNLQSYSVDRRAFEHWVDGDWVAADSLIGLIRSHAELQALPCRHGHAGPCTADHIGPISLGFMHRPEFQFLCRACNSAKNNRLTMHDVQVLRTIETRGERVASWYCEALWRTTQALATNQETALRLSKLLRDNRHTALSILGEVAAAGHLVFLCTLLGLQYAERRLDSEELEVESHIARFKNLRSEKRTGRYVGEQKARRIRVAFDALTAYLTKPERNASLVIPDQARRKIERAKELLSKGTPHALNSLNHTLASALSEGTDEIIRKVAEKVPGQETLPRAYIQAKVLLSQAMEDVAGALRSAWEASRYTRAERPA